MSFEKSAKEIYNALFITKSTKQKEQKILNVIKLNNHEQRLNIREKYEQLYSKKTNLIEDFKNELSGDYSKIVQYLFMTPIDFDCLSIHNGLEKLFFDAKCIFEIITLRPFDYLQQLKLRYYELYKKDLEKIFIDKFGNEVGNGLITLMKIKRDTNNGKPDYDSAKQKVNMLLENNPELWLKNLNIFANIFAKSSPQELILIGRIYYELTKKDFPSEINEKISSQSSRFLTEVLYNTCHPAEIFASKVYNAIIGLGTDTNTLDRIIVTRNEIDMKVIKILYKHIFKVDMIDDIIDDTSGIYQQLLIYLCSKE